MADIKRTPIAELSSTSTRQSKIVRLPDWAEIIAAIDAGIKKTEALQLTLGPESVEAFGGNVKKASLAFVIKLRNHGGYKDRYRFQIVGGTEIRVTNKEFKR